MHATRLLAPGLLVLALSGCGFLLTKGPPPGHQQLQSFSCTDDNAGPILDIVWGSLNVLGAIVIASDPDAYSDPGLSALSGIAWGVLSGFSAASGFNAAGLVTAHAAGSIVIAATTGNVTGTARIVVRSRE